MAEKDVISTIKGLRDAILNYEVKEVSQDLVFSFPAGPSLYDPNIGIAWSGSSATLYDLLVLNNRFKSSSVDQSKGDANSLKVDRKVITALQRGVGFGFDYQKLLSAEELEHTDYPVFEVQDAFVFAPVVFDKKQGPFVAYDSEGKEITIEKLSIDQRIPTQDFWKELLNQRISESVDNPLPIPQIVFSEISRRYANNDSPASNYGRIVGIEDPLFFGGGGEGILKPDGTNFLDGVPDFADWDDFPTSFVSSVGSFELMKSVNKRFGTSTASPKFSLSQASGIFYDEFLRDRLEEYFELDRLEEYFGLERLEGYLRLDQFEKYFQFKNGGDRFESRQAKIVDELVLLVRVFQNFQLASTGLNTGSNGEGFSNAANPLVGRSYRDITLDNDFYVDTFAGQEFIVDNLVIPAPGEFAANGWLSLESSQQNPIPGDKAYPRDGWFALDHEKNLDGSDTGGGLDDYTGNFLINDQTIKYAAFDPSSVSSDTLSAAALTSKSANTLKGSTHITNDLFDGIRIDDLVGFGSNFLPDEFSTFISLAGGVDRVTGSSFADVIIGPGESSLHGTMTFNSGAGADFVSPGRGQSLWLLGEGRDVISYSKGDLFGQSIFLDYNKDDDLLIYEKGISAEIDDNDRSILRLKDQSSGAMKTILLSGSSDPDWSEASLIPVG